MFLLSNDAGYSAIYQLSWLATAGIVATWFHQPQLAPIPRGFLVLFVITSLGNVQQASWSLGLGLLTTALNLIGFAIAIRWGIVALAAFVIYGYLVFRSNSEQ